MKRFIKKPLTWITLTVTTVVLTMCAHWRPAKRFDPAPPQANQLRVATWNVGYFAATSNKNLRDVDIERVANTINTIQPDVIVLQELGKVEQADAIIKQLNGQWWHHAIKTGHGEQAIAILSGIEIVDIESFENGGRMGLGATLTTTQGKDIYLVGVHSPHPARGIKENKNSITQSLQHADKQSQSIRIITGDMNYNFDPETEDDFYQEITETYGDGTIQLGETYYAHTRIDHMFHYPKDLKVDLGQSGIVDLPIRFTKVPGFRDHRPIVVTYEL